MPYYIEPCLLRSPYVTALGPYCTNSIGDKWSFFSNTVTYIYTRTHHLCTIMSDSVANVSICLISAIAEVEDLDQDLDLTSLSHASATPTSTWAIYSSKMTGFAKASIRYRGYTWVSSTTLHQDGLLFVQSSPKKR